jgi:hypothetical protein
MKIKTSLILAFGTGILIAGCREKAKTPPPELSVPIAPGSASAPSGAAAIPPEVEVKASSGPVELSLAVYRTKISMGSLRFRVRLKNTGKNKMRVLSEPFTDPSVIQKTRGENTTGIYLEVLNSAGRSPGVNLRGASRIDPASLPPFLTKDERAEIDSWTAGGLSGEEVQRRVAEIIRRKHSDGDLEAQAFWMEPGASTATIPYAVGNRAHSGDPIGNFAELTNYDLPPGKYRIRAVYDLYSPPEFYRKNHLAADAWEVRVKTPFVDFEVLP